MPMQVLVEAETQDGQKHSILLQNAETVRLVGPQPVNVLKPNKHKSSTCIQDGAAELAEKLGKEQSQAVAVAVSELQIGQHIYLHLQSAARHTGISIRENIVEQ